MHPAFVPVWEPARCEGSERSPVTQRPLPLSSMVVGLLLALLTTVRVRTYWIRAVGRKVTRSLQSRPTAREVGQVPRVTVNGPVADSELMTSGAVPVFLSRTSFTVLVLMFRVLKSTDAGRVATAAATPVPLSETPDGEPVPL